jgi:hypothetical protein
MPDEPEIARGHARFCIRPERIHDLVPEAELMWSRSQQSKRGPHVRLPEVRFERHAISLDGRLPQA